ncbi:MAG: protein kinase [Candidatus Eisenbacteria bacterium]
MSLTPGTKLGPYEILAPLGAGGMGEVYRAKDTRLSREVAVKVLPQHLSTNAEVRSRFEREAKTVSSLNHPNICTLFDVGREGDTDYLVMELIEGETLAQRLGRGALPVADVLKLGAQIADALDRAHRAGVVHRDLKPGNVMLTRGGAKLMDFGLARATGMAGPISGSGMTMAALTQSPTVAQPLTAEGTLVGTFQYMSPEQLEGKEADARADLWALGCVLHEMATGRRAFDGGSQAGLIGAIMNTQPPPVSQVAPLSPPALDRLVGGCLVKDPADRIQSAHDVRMQLQWMAEQGQNSGSFAGLPLPPVVRARRAGLLGWTVAAAFGAAALLCLLLLIRNKGEESRVLRAALPLPPDVALAITGDDAGPPALSPDGRMLAFGASGRGSGPRVWLRSLDDLSVRPLPGTEGGFYPFWSPDGRSIGFFAAGQLKRIDLAGGAVLNLCSVRGARGGTWSRNGVILFSPDWVSGLWQVPASGGTARVVTTLDTTAESTHRWPVFLPDGKHFLYLAAKHDAPETSSALWFASLDGRVRKRLMASPSNAAYASGWLLFVRDSTLLAQRFDPGHGRLIGVPQPTQEVVQFDATTWRAMMTAAESGVLVYGPGGNSGAFRITWFDRSGRVLGTLGNPGNHFTVAISPDGSRAVIETQLSPNADLWVYDLASGAGTRLTTSPQDDSEPLWAPDGTQIAFATRMNGPHYEVSAVRADGSAAPRVLIKDADRDVWALQWLDGGRALLVGRGAFQSGVDHALWWHPLDGGLPQMLVPASPGCTGAQVSPTRRWLAFDSRVSGRREVYVVPMPTPGAVVDSVGGGSGRWQVSAGGGACPKWSPDGRELFYKRPDDTMVTVSVDGQSGTFRNLGEKPLFQAFQRGDIPTYDVSADGARFLISTSSTERQAPLVVVTNWTKRLGSR